MASKVVFLDRDGTINVDKDYLYKISDFEFLPGVLEALRLLQNAGFLLIIITNQSGIARGYYTEQEYLKLNEWMISKLEQEGIHIADSFYCPHHPEAVIPEYRCRCKCRKPGTELFEMAVEKYGVDLSQSYAIGDKLRDCCICAETECRGYLIGTKEDEDIISRVKAGLIRNVEYKEDLLECAIEISVN